MSCSGVLSSSAECTASGAWIECMASLFRTYIGDFDSPPTWSDARIAEILKAAAYQVKADLTSCSVISAPTINVCTGEFDANPYLYPAFVNLWVLKGACLIDQGAVRTRAASEGIKAVAGPASLQITSTGPSSYTLLLKQGPCGAYDSLKEDLCFRSPITSAASCSQIVATFVSEFYERCDENGSCSYYR